jgi:hypothetical protein
MRTDAIESTDSTGRRLVVEFSRHGDRYSHRIACLDSSGNSTTLLESVEGAPDDPWPSSPPLQNLHFESLADGRRVALLVGMAGSSHWSASIEPLTDRPAFLFDIACRHKERPALLANSYRELSPGAKLLPAGAATLQAQGAQLAISPLDISGPSATTRWQYTVELREGEAPAEP